MRRYTGFVSETLVNSELLGKIVMRVIIAKTSRGKKKNSRRK